MKFTSHSSRSLLPFYTGGALKPKPSSHLLQYCLFIRLQLCGFLFFFGWYQGLLMIKDPRPPRIDK